LCMDGRVGLAEEVVGDGEGSSEIGDIGDREKEVEDERWCFRCGW
jgi:hypothetical protein